MGKMSPILLILVLPALASCVGRPKSSLGVGKKALTTTKGSKPLVKPTVPLRRLHKRQVEARRRLAARVRKNQGKLSSFGSAMKASSAGMVTHLRKLRRPR